jgi:anion-transporting  ArsA/GET3 family ATPase
MAALALSAVESSTDAAAAVQSVLSRRMVFVTGKGGVGKSTVAAAFALDADARGRGTIVCELGGPGAAERVPGLRTITIDPEAALVEWMTRNIGRAGAALLARSGTFRYFVAAAPGARELVVIGKAWDLTRSGTGPRGDRLVVVDAPATGHAIALLQAPRTFSRLDRVGPIGEQAGEVRDFLADPSHSAIALVCTPAEMPVTETLELATAVEDATGRPPDVVVVNQVLPDRFDEHDIDAIERALTASDDSRLRAAARPALAAWRRARDQDHQLRRLRAGLTMPIVKLPFLFVPSLGPRELRTLAARLA